MKMWKTLSVAMGFIALTGCAQLSPDFKEQNQALKNYHAAEVTLGVAKAHLGKVEGQLEKAKVSVAEAQIKRGSAKSILDKQVLGQ